MAISKPILKYLFRDDFKHLGWIVLSVLAINIFLGLVSGGNASLGGLEFIFGFILFVGWAESFNEDLHFYTQLGVSRRTISLNTTIGMVISSAVFTVAFMVTAGLLTLVASAFPVDSISISTLYTRHLAGMGAVQGHLVHFAWTWAILLAFSAFGQFSSSLYYILSKLGRYIALAVIIFTVVLAPRFVLPHFLNLMFGDLDAMIEVFVNILVYGGSWVSLCMSIAANLCIAAACLIGSWLCTRRCKMKK